MLPADLLPFLLMFVSCFVLLLSWIRSLVSKRRVVAATFLFIVSLLLCGASFRVRRAYARVRLEGETRIRQIPLGVTEK